jgi:DNA replication protein DnaC
MLNILAYQPKICKVCGKEFAIKMAGNIPMRISEGHEKCKEILNANDRYAEEIQSKKDDEERCQFELAGGFRYSATDWTRRTWNGWAENSENKPVADVLRVKGYNEKGTVLSGGPGIGKTHLLAATAVEIHRASRRKFLFVDFARWSDLIRSAEFSKSLELISELENIDTLFIDDIGTNSITDHLEDKFCRILSYRLEFNKPTYISTNLTLKEADKTFSPRIMSRLRSLCDWIDIKRIKSDWRNK